MTSKIKYYLKVDGVVKSLEFPFEHDGPNDEWNEITSDQFLSPDEIAEHEFNGLNYDDVHFFQTTTKEDLILLHHTYGTWIRNNYGLWHPNNPHVIPGDLDEGHPDGLSMLVIQAIFNRCAGPYAAYDNAMSII